MKLDSMTKLIDGILEREGGFVDHPKDRGGPTNLGITQATLASWRGHPVTIEDVRMLTEAEAREIYRRRYIEDPGFPAIAHEELRLILVDAAVQHGPKTAVRLLQYALEIKPDGILGPVTLTVANAREPHPLILDVFAERLRFYGRIISTDHTQATFAAGWMNRMADLLGCFVIGKGDVS